METSELNLEALKELISMIEDSEKTAEMIEWMENISKPSFGLIDSLILTFLDEMDDNIKDSNSILRALTKLFEFIPESILPQLKSHSKFPLALSKYLTSTKLQDLEGGGFILLVEIFSSKEFKNVANDNFIKSLLDSLAFIQDEKIYISIVNILMAISSESFNIENDMILKQSYEHPNQRFFAEYILHALNKASKGQISKILSFLITVFVFQESKMPGVGFFYKNDFHILCDVIMRDIENTNDEDVRAKSLEVLHVILKTEQYKKEGYRKKAFGDLLEELIQEDVSEKAKQIAKEIQQAKLV